MRCYQIYSFHSCRVLASRLTLAEACELAGPFGDFVVVERMKLGDFFRLPA